MAFRDAEVGRAYKRAWQRQRRASDPTLVKNQNATEATKARKAAWRDTNREIIRAKAREKYKELGPSARRAKNLRDSFGMTLEEYNDMFAKQDGKCAICKSPETVPVPRQPDKVKWLAVDHCHATGRIRGLLCQGCNVSIARFRDDTSLLHSAIEYLERHQQ